MPAHSTTGQPNSPPNAGPHLPAGCKVSIAAKKIISCKSLICPGWITIFAWQATVASVTFLVATQVQGLVILNYDNYVPERWHGTLLMWALLASAFLVNTIGIKALPHIESLSGICHVLFFFALLIPMVYLSPHSTPKFVFTKFINEGGWSSDGISWCVGLLTVTFPFIGKPTI